MTAVIRCGLNDDALSEAVEKLRRGELVGLPTETVYGVAADATNAEAVARIFAAKDRPQFNPLIIHVASLAQAERHGVFDARARALAERFWPGPLTLVVPQTDSPEIARLATAGLDTIALRAPAHPIARAVIAAAKIPLAAPSANRSGSISPTSAADVANELGDRLGLILDGGRCEAGLESTVVGLIDDEAYLLRPGAMARDEIEDVIGPLATPVNEDAKRSPGLLTRHYAPRRARVRLDADSARPGEALLGFGALDWSTVNLSERGDLAEAASRLFAALRALDEAGYASIAVSPIPAHGLGEAIRDRLKRAAEFPVRESHESP